MESELQDPHDTFNIQDDIVMIPLISIAPEIGDYPLQTFASSTSLQFSNIEFRTLLLEAVSYEDKQSSKYVGLCNVTIALERSDGSDAWLKLREN